MTELQWEVKGIETCLKTIPFTVEEVSLSFKNNQKSAVYHRLRSPDWANIIAVTDQNELIVINQSRVGSMSNVWEFPGGAVDAGEDPEVAASRELEEETGFVSASKLTKLCAINPNPAIMTNLIHFYTATGCRLAEKRERFPDANEAIQVATIPIENLDSWIQSNNFDSALALLGIHLASAAGHLPKVGQKC